MAEGGQSIESKAPQVGTADQRPVISRQQAQANLESELLRGLDLEVQAYAQKDQEKLRRIRERTAQLVAQNNLAEGKSVDATAPEVHSGVFGRIKSLFSPKPPKLSPREQALSDYAMERFRELDIIRRREDEERDASIATKLGEKSAIAKAENDGLESSINQ